MRTKPDINSNPRALGAFRVQFMPASLGRVAQLEFEPEGGKMSAILKWTMALALLSGTVYAAQPPDVVGTLLWRVKAAVNRLGKQGVVR